MSADGATVAAGLYLHIPFCRTKCHYCDFNTYAGIEDLIPTYVAALAEEMRRGAAATERQGRRLVSVFFGGGTPSLLSGAEVARLLDVAAQAWGVEPSAEITLEANPGTIDLAHLRALRAAGVNRLSFGVQSFEPLGLRALGRTHGVGDVLSGVAAARQAGFENISIDLIYGWPAQRLEGWAADLSQAIALELPHLSLYPLTVETGTPLATMVRSGQVQVADDDRLADAYQIAVDRLGTAGYSHYEISNWARSEAGRPSQGSGATPSLASQHNLLYWRNREYWGGGPGAHGHWSGRRWMNLRNPRQYIARIQAGAPLVAQAEQIDASLAMAETMLLGLRLSEGVSVSGFTAQHGVSPWGVFADPLRRLTERRAIIGVGDALVVPAAERFRLDGIVAEFLPDAESARTSD